MPDAPHSSVSDGSVAAEDDAPLCVIELSVNLDDATGERQGEAIDAMLRAGALDAWATPITMKKGRPGVVLSVLSREADRAALALKLIEATGSFGVRYRAWDRFVLDRQFVDAPTRLGPVRLKVGSLDGRVLAIKPEFETVRELAASAGVSLAEAERAAQAAADAHWARATHSQQEGGGRDG